MCISLYPHKLKRVRGTTECFTDTACALNEKFGKSDQSEWGRMTICFLPYVSAAVLGYVQKAYTYWESLGGRGGGVGVVISLTRVKLDIHT